MRMSLLSIILTAILGTTLYQVKIGIDARESQLLMLESEIADTERQIAVLEAEWAYLSRPERVLELSDNLLQMQPIDEDRILPIEAIPMRILPKFNDQLADVGVITLLPPGEALPNRNIRTVAGDPDSALIRPPASVSVAPVVQPAGRLCPTDVRLHPHSTADRPCPAAAAGPGAITPHCRRSAAGVGGVCAGGIRVDCHARCDAGWRG